MTTKIKTTKNAPLQRVEKLCSMAKVAKCLKTKEEYLFEYFKRKGFLKPSSNKFSASMKEIGLVHRRPKGQKNENKFFYKDCYVSEETLHGLTNVCQKINFEYYFKKSQQEKAKNTKLAIEYFKKDGQGYNEESNWTVVRELDFYSKNFPGHKRRYTIEEVCEIFEISGIELFTLLARYNWISHSNFTFHMKYFYMGLCSSSSANFDVKDVDNFYTHSYVTFEGLNNISLLMRYGRKLFW